MQDRRDGKFDAYLDEHTEETFGESGFDGTEDITVDSKDADMDSSDGEWSRRMLADAKDTQRRKNAA